MPVGSLEDERGHGRRQKASCNAVIFKTQRTAAIRGGHNDRKDAILNECLLPSYWNDANKIF
jgi:hypothetical protein